ncbi:hypothetical protein HPB50_026404 [Hyalomma asiaticum]|uniref:Uncharacterized protein n=1 Tax=Hyalomma asiaticum TaxID=266040 RepID=A0ACB7T299_HYAAI|nr:hypothetical protein HPB50_026404 [Hyalomma asiaticum]
MCVEPHRRDEARTRVVGVLSKLQRRRKVDPLLPEERRALKRLRDNERIVILPADKGNATVVLNKLDYEKKMLRMLEDKETYKPLNRDPTPKTQRDLQKLLADDYGESVQARPGQSKAPRFSSSEGDRGVSWCGETWAAGDHVIPLYVPQCKECDCCRHPRANLCSKIR